MSKYLKLFETTPEYEAYINGGGVVLPNVSVAKDDLTKVYYNPYKFFVKLSLNNGKVVELQGSGELTNAMVSQYKSSSIVSVELGELCTSIGKRAFSNCYGLTSITISNSVTSIGKEAFYYCYGLESIIVENGNTIYDSRENCNAIIETETNTLIVGCKNTVIPNSITSIGDGAFSNCKGLTSITIPNSVTSIGASAFEGCSSLTSITIPNSVTNIGDYAFSYCYGLESIIVENGNTIYDSRENCNAIIETATNTLIAGCKNTVIPNSVTRIGDGAFRGCSGLTSITIPNSVTSIGQQSIAYTGLTSITSLAAKAPTIQSDTFYYIKTGGRLTVPSGSSGYETWMSKGNYYLGKYNWTKIEQ